jgi:hypothetical protein
MEYLFFIGVVSALRGARSSPSAATCAPSCRARARATLTSYLRVNAMPCDSEAANAILSPLQSHTHARPPSLSTPLTSPACHSQLPAAALPHRVPLDVVEDRRRADVPVLPHTCDGGEDAHGSRRLGRGAGIGGWRVERGAVRGCAR